MRRPLAEEGPEAMNPPNALISLDDITTQVQAELAQSDLLLKPKSLTAIPTVDGLDEEVWQLVLTLPKPLGETWEVDDVFAVRRAAILAFDKLMDGDRRERPGQTLAVVTTDEADEIDIAPEELPVEGEDRNETEADTE